MLSFILAAAIFAKADASSNQPVEPFRIIGNVYYVGANEVAKYPNEIADYRRTFAILAKLPCDVFLGSHGSFFNLSEKRAALAKGRDPNPFVDPAGYKAYVESAEKRFRAAVKAQKPE